MHKVCVQWHDWDKVAGMVQRQRHPASITVQAAPASALRGDAGGVPGA